MMSATPSQSSQPTYLRVTWADLLTLAYIAKYPEMHPVRARALAEGKVKPR